MKKIIITFIFIITFILSFCTTNAKAQFLEFSSVTFDNSGAFITLNSTDNLEYNIKASEINIDYENNKAFFELSPARISADKEYVTDFENITGISITQKSTNPDIVGITLDYKNNFKPEYIDVKKINNTIFVKFKNPPMSNYYFQEIYKESETMSVFEKINIQQKLQTQRNIVNEINSAFSDIINSNEDENFVLSPKNLNLKSKFYINSITLKGDMPIIDGTGTFTLSKPIYLTSPNRVAFDIKNTIVNPLLRNKEIQIGNDKIKIGQFDINTARIVITSEKPENYIPVVLGDSQRIGFFNSYSTSPLNLYTTLSDMTSVTKEKVETNNYSAKFAFTKPLAIGIKRTSGKLEISLFNLNHYFVGAINSELRGTPFESLKISDIKNGGAKIQIPSANNSDKYDIFLGADGKTLRIKLKSEVQYIPKEEPITEEIVVPQVVQKHTGGKKYIVIDAGHGGSDCGALRNGINEKDITLDIAKRVQEQLEKKGYVVAMTRTDDTYVSLQDRVDYSEIFNPDIFVSIHVNSSNSESPSGIETHYYKDNSLKLAKYVHASLLNNINAKDRGLFKSKFYVINHTTAPAILIETGFISNPNERAQLITESRKNATTKAIVEGIDEYFKK